MSDHAELLAKTSNKYELVLTVARRAKLIKEEIARNGGTETQKPIPLALQEILEEANEEPHPAFLTH